MLENLCVGGVIEYHCQNNQFLLENQMYYSNIQFDNGIPINKLKEQQITADGNFVQSMQCALMEEKA